MGEKGEVYEVQTFHVEVPRPEKGGEPLKFVKDDWVERAVQVAMAVTGTPDEQHVQRQLSRLGQKLRALRKERDLSCEEVCAALEISPSVLGVLERGWGEANEYRRLFDAWTQVLGISRQEIECMLPKAIARKDEEAS